MKSLPRSWAGLTALFLFACALPACADVVKIGMTLPLTGVQQGNGNETEQVWRAFGKYAANNKLLRTHSLEFITLDDEFNGPKALANTQKLMSSGAAVIVSTLGIPQVNGMIPDLEKNRVPLLGIGSGSPTLRDKSPAVFHVKATFADEMQKVAGVMGTLGFGKVVLVIDDVADRPALAEVFRKTLESTSSGNSKLVGIVKVPQQNPDFAGAAREVMKAQPDAVFVIAIGGIATPTIKALRAADFPIPIYTWSVAATSEAIKTLGEAARGVAYSAIVPNPSAGKEEVSRRFRAFAQQTGIAPSFRAMEIYITGMVLVDALNRIPGKVTGKEVWQALEQSKTMDFGGYAVNFSPTNRNGSNYVNIVIVGPGGKFME